MTAEAFDTNRYHKNQMEAFRERMVEGYDQIIEFGGKPFGDHHASRVLPGYDPDIKALILQDLTVELGSTAVTLAMALHAKDILSSPDGRRVSRRIRGDSGLSYDEEVLRLVRQSRERFDLPLHTVVLSCLPRTMSQENEEYVGLYREQLDAEGVVVKTIYEIDTYPYLEPGTVTKTLMGSDRPSSADHLIVVSPGGGSGKFGVAVTDIAHKLHTGRNPNFVKFETFPVFGLPMEHPLNVAFLAATADLPNVLLQTHEGQTNYDKDVQNLSILQALMHEHPDSSSPMHSFQEPTDMGVNVIETGVTNNPAIVVACMQEIARRIERYKIEHANGTESLETIDRTTAYLQDVTNT